MNRFHKKTIYEALGREPVHPFPARMAPGIALGVMSDIDESLVLDPMMGAGTVLAMARANEIGRASCRGRGEISVTGVQTCALPICMAPGIALGVMSDIDESLVLDPMMGSGTVLAMARANGHRGIGFDIDPLAVLSSKVWTTAFDPEKIRDEAGTVLEDAWGDFRNLTAADAYPSGADDETGQFIRYWFDGYARRQLAALSMTVEKVKSEITRNALWCAFSRLIISKQSGASRAMDLSHSRPHRVFEPERKSSRLNS